MSTTVLYLSNETSVDQEIVVIAGDDSGTTYDVAANSKTAFTLALTDGLQLMFSVVTWSSEATLMATWVGGIWSTEVNDYPDNFSFESNTFTCSR